MPGTLVKIIIFCMSEKRIDTYKVTQTAQKHPSHLKKRKSEGSVASGCKSRKKIYLSNPNLPVSSKRILEELKGTYNAHELVKTENTKQLKACVRRRKE